MKKKLAMLFFGLLVTMAGHAQFEQDKIYVSTGVSGVNLGFNGSEKWKLDAQAKAGYFFDRDWMVLVNAEMGLYKDVPDTYKAGLGLRYYIEQNGLYLGLGANYVHANRNYNDVLPAVTLGYAFFLNRTVTIEPEVYYNQSLKNHGDYSGFGFRLGFGIYFE